MFLKNSFLITVIENVAKQKISFPNLVIITCYMDLEEGPSILIPVCKIVKTRIGNKKVKQNEGTHKCTLKS